MHVPDEIELFMGYFLAHDPTDELRAKLIEVLTKRYPLEVQSINKVKTAKEIEDHHDYMRLASILGRAGYHKRGIWFYYGGRK